jgi:hypothetical protein
LQRLRISHGSVVAYVALFVALGGTGWAATQSGARQGAAVHHPSAPPVKVRCSANAGGRRVSCRVLGGKLTGPPGPPGRPGPPGPPGPVTSGQTILTQAPTFTKTSDGTFPWATGSGDSNDGGEQQEWVAYAPIGLTGTTAQTTLDLTLLSPGQLPGGVQNFDSVEFCYGEVDNSNPGAPSSDSASLAITSAAVEELEEPVTNGTTPPVTPVTNTTPEAPPYSPPVSLTNTDFNLNNAYGCETVTPSAPAAIDPTGYLELVLSLSFTASPYSGIGNFPDATLSLGRVTVTYGS